MSLLFKSQQQVPTQIIPEQPPREVVGAARDKNHHSFSARGGKKVAHHCFRQYLKKQTANKWLYTLKVSFRQ